MQLLPVLLSAALMVTTFGAEGRPHNSTSSSSDLHRGAEWLVGRFVKRKAGINIEQMHQGISTPGIWDGLPDDAVNHGGFLLEIEGNYERTQKLAVNYYTINSNYYFTFDNTSNDSEGLAEDRILDALRSPWGNIMRPCSINGTVTTTAFAFPNEEEVLFVLRQQPSQMEGVTAQLRNPEHAYLFNPRTLKIERLQSAHVVCKGYLNSLGDHR